MSHTALVKLAQVATPDVLLGSAEGRACRTVFSRAALQLRPNTPVVVNHDTTRQVGVVRELVVWPDVDGHWVYARCDVVDPPAWLCRGTKASFEYVPLHTWEFGDWMCVKRGLVTEVSVLPVSVQPAEPRAEVVLLERSAAVTSDPAAARDVVLPAGTLIRRPNIGRVIGVR